MYKALEVEFINEFTKAETHKISLKKPTLYGKLHIPEPEFTKKRFYVALEKKMIFQKIIHQNVDDFLEYLQNLRAIL